MSSDPTQTSQPLEFEQAPSPLIYPGGKSRAIPIIVPLILEGMTRANTNDLVAPFLGGGNLEVTCAQQGARVSASDAFGPLVNFWRHLLANPAGLAGAVQKYLTANVNDNDGDFKQLQKLVPQMPDGLEKAAAFYVINRLSFYGMTLSGYRSPKAQITVNGVGKLADFSAPSLSVEHLDYREALRAYPNAFAYLDPPYEFLEEKRNSYYGVDGDTHRGFDHDALFEAVKDRPNWIMSLNADEHVLARYADFPMAFPSWHYGMTKSGQSNEVLIFSRNLTDLAVIARERVEEDKAVKAERNPVPANDGSSPVWIKPWPSPDLSVLSETAMAAPPFPKTVLGEDWAPWCGSVAAGANAHFDYVAATLLTAAAGLIGNAVTVRANATFVQPSVLWTCLVGRSGAGKTPATTLISDIVDDLEARYARRHRLRDVTVAASVKLAAENPKGQQLFRDELSGWWAAMRRSGGEDFWLEAYNGKAFSKDRKNDEPIFVRNLSISVIGGAQPSTVKDITTDGKNRGFSARWLFAYPEPIEGYADSDVEIDVDWATAALARLFELPVGAACIPLSADAQSVFRVWWDAKKREIADHDGLWAEWMQKQGGNALRLALCLEMLKWSASGATDLPEDIAAQTLQDALTLIDEWAIPMAQRTLEVMYRSTSDQWAVALAKHLRRHDLATFNARRLRRGESGGPAGVLADPKVMDQACHTLMGAGLIRHVGVRNHASKGRSPMDFETNPALLNLEANWP
jgi:DNA adenine methylase